MNAIYYVRWVEWHEVDSNDITPYEGKFYATRALAQFACDTANAKSREDARRSYDRAQQTFEKRTATRDALRAAGFEEEANDYIVVDPRIMYQNPDTMLDTFEVGEAELVA